MLEYYHYNSLFNLFVLYDFFNNIIVSHTITYLIHFLNQESHFNVILYKQLIKINI